MSAFWWVIIGAYSALLAAGIIAVRSLMRRIAALEPPEQYYAEPTSPWQRPDKDRML